MARILQAREPSKSPSMRPFFLLTLTLMLHLSIGALHTLKGQSSDTEEAVKGAIEAGNASTLARHFTKKVDLSIPGTDDVYSSAQAEQILKEFFQENPPEELILEHGGTSKLKDQYRIGKLKTSEGDFRLTYFLKKVEGDPKVKKLRIEAHEGDF